MNDPAFIQDCLTAELPFPGYDSKEYNLWLIAKTRGCIEATNSITLEEKMKTQVK